MPAETIDVFISHSTADGYLSKAISQFIEEELNLSVYLAEESLGQVSSDWRKELIEKIKACKCFIPIITKNSLNRPWVMFESGAAAIQEKPFFVLTTSKETQVDLMGYPKGNDFNYDISTKKIFKKFINALYYEFNGKDIPRNFLQYLEDRDIFKEILKSASQRRIFIGGSFPDTEYKHAIKTGQTQKKGLQLIIEQITTELLKRGYKIASCPDVRYVGKMVAETVLDWCQENNKRWQDHYEISGDIFYLRDDLDDADGDKLRQMILDGFKASRREYLKSQDVILFIGGNNRTFIEYEVAQELDNIKICAIPFFGGTSLKIFEEQKDKERPPVRKSEPKWKNEILQGIIDFIDKY